MYYKNINKITMINIFFYMDQKSNKNLLETKNKILLYFMDKKIYLFIFMAK